MNTNTYLTISEASSITHVSPEVLNKLVLSGKIRFVNTTSEILVHQEDVVTTLPLRERPEYSEFDHLAGVKISMSEAARRYGVVHQNISRWVKNGMIEKLGELGRQTLIDEAQVATAAKIYNTVEGHQGMWVFRAGLPYNKKVKGGC